MPEYDNDLRLKHNYCSVPFEISRRTVLLHIFLIHSKWIGIFAVITVSILLSLSFVLKDLRFIILAMMGVFIVFPLVLGFLYINYAIHPDIAFNSLSHRIILSSDNNMINLAIIKESDSGKDDGEEAESKDVTNMTEELYYLKPIPVSSLNSCIIGSKEYIIEFNKDGLLFIPFTLINKSEELRNLIESLLERDG